MFVILKTGATLSNDGLETRVITCSPSVNHLLDCHVNDLDDGQNCTILVGPVGQILWTDCP